MYDFGVGADCCEEADLLVGFRPLTPAETDALNEDLHAEADAERSPAERARFRVQHGN
jgi:hypothetical protein